MYLKTLEMVGFKSFAEKTRLEYQPGITAIVGPNGCGKSNVSDAIRWVIGETSPKAMRGSSMADCIFNGTDARKALNMGEVSLTLADCEATLGTEYNEVTITRRVFRSGEGQYFINKTPCRLKDIQRLFMDTGIGTTSYSVMEQGRIDRVLSSRPEDRREIFEEASGITKFKADKKEAIRKLDTTEANLIRLADVIREVKRQIGSLQRQAGKARRYKSINEELRVLDLYSTRERLREADREIQKLEAEVSSLTGKSNAAHREVEELEEKTATMHEGMVSLEREIASVAEAGVQARSDLDRTRDRIEMNQQRIAEYKEWSERNTREIDETTRQLTESRELLERSSVQKGEAAAMKDSAESKLKESQDRFEAHRQQMDGARTGIQRMRSELLELESRISRLRNQLVEIETRERAALIQREKLTAEKARMEQAVETLGKRQEDMRKVLEEAGRSVEEKRVALNNAEGQRQELSAKVRTLHQELGEIQSQVAAGQARMEMLADDEESSEDFPGGARMLLDAANPLEINREAVLGALATHLEIDEGYGTAVEAVLRPWLDALVVSGHGDGVDILSRLVSVRKGAARLLCADGAVDDVTWPSGMAGSPLLDHVRGDGAVVPVLKRLLGGVRVVDSLADLPVGPTNGFAAVTREGALLHPKGDIEFWMADSRVSNPVARQNALSAVQRRHQELTRDAEQLKQRIAGSQDEIRGLDEQIGVRRGELDECRRSVAQQEGQAQAVEREAREARQRLDTVSFELENLESEHESGGSEREAIAKRIDETTEQRERISEAINRQTHELGDLESRHSELQGEVAELRISYAAQVQKAEHLTSQHDALTNRVAELESTIRGRSDGLKLYEQNIAKLTAVIEESSAQLTALEETVKTREREVEKLRIQRAEQAGRLKEMESLLTQRRASLEELRTAKSAVDVRCAESRMRRQNQLERVMSDYHVTVDAIIEAEDPDWQGGDPMTLDQCETRVAELRTKLDAMGPVNLVAIEEYNELEERFTFLTEQEKDLINSKEQLMEMIRKINRTTSEMFRTTFDLVNTNFQTMFTRLFNGGTAQLVLVNEEDVLECGIEIIARPPGKRLQNISLLSGGERTLTAVALLFAIYMIKPSPFCLLDELDAPLDDSNIGRFVDVLKDFVNQSQFIIITHNQHTIAAADVLYGVTMPQKGISRVMSMKFSDHEMVLTGKQAPGEALRGLHDEETN